MSAVQHIDQKAGDIAAVLLAHYQRNARDLPWRAQPGGGLPDPYQVWLSEIMLQQTTVAAVIPYFEKFTSRWPDFGALAAADEADVMAAWAGLGYYARARNLIACAKAVVVQHEGQMPVREPELLKLPGIGYYTAAAIAAIAFGQRAVVVDANVERVVARLFAIDAPLPASKPAIRAATDAITPDARAGDFAQAMMDLGAGLCSVRNPSCMICPLLPHCEAGQAGAAEAYPVKLPKKAKPHRTGTAYWIEKDNAVWLVTRGGKGMLAGMRALPDDGWSAKDDGHGVPPFASDWRVLPGTVVHVFTHFSLALKVAVTASIPDMKALGRGEYWPVKLLDKAGLPTLFKKVADAAMAQGER
ncbi:MAG: A/G-specific adenine glycosylase [Sphingorhabdus sp.]